MININKEKIINNILFFTFGSLAVALKFYQISADLKLNIINFLVILVICLLFILVSMFINKTTSLVYSELVAFAQAAILFFVIWLACAGLLLLWCYALGSSSGDMILPTWLIIRCTFFMAFSFYFRGLYIVKLNDKLPSNFKILALFPTIIVVSLLIDFVWVWFIITLTFYFIMPVYIKDYIFNIVTKFVEMSLKNRFIISIFGGIAFYIIWTLCIDPSIVHAMPPKPRIHPPNITINAQPGSTVNYFNVRAGAHLHLPPGPQGMAAGGRVIAPTDAEILKPIISTASEVIAVGGAGVGGAVYVLGDKVIGDYDRGSPGGHNPHSGGSA